MMRRVLLLVIVALIAVPVMALAEEAGTQLELMKKEPKTVKIEGGWLDDRAKLGLALGEPWGVVFGYHFTKTFEANILLGSRFKFDTFTIGGSGLFTLINFQIGKQIFPFSVGPAAYFDFGDGMSMDALGVVRIEHSFDIPLNLYLEGGVGYTLFNRTGFAWTTAVGARYVF
jgi:hypothetical protein